MKEKIFSFLAGGLDSLKLKAMSIQRVTHLNGTVTYRATVRIRGGASKTAEFDSAKAARKWLAENGEKLEQPGLRGKQYALGMMFLIFCTALGAMLIFAANQKFDLAYFTIDYKNYQENPHCRILMVGNSHLYVNDVPKMVNTISKSTPEISDDCGIDMIAHGGWKLYDHLNDNAVMDAIKSDVYRTIVLQEQSTTILYENEKYISRNAFHALVRAAKAETMRPVVMVTWAHQDGSPFMQSEEYMNIKPPRSSAEMAARVYGYYDQLSREQQVELAPVGNYWNVAARLESDIPLYNDDGVHASVQGSYLAALILHKTLFGGDPKRITYVPEGVDDEEAQRLRALAAKETWQVVPKWRQ